MLKDNIRKLGINKEILKKLIKLFFVLLLIIGAFCYFCKPIYYRIYFGDRIKGTISVYVDEKAYLLQPKEIQGTDELELADNGKIAELSIHGGEYGGYPIYLYLDTADMDALELMINCYQHNWWNVTEFDITIEIDTKQNIISFNVNCTTIADNGEKLYDKIDKQQSLDEENLGISFGL